MLKNSLFQVSLLDLKVQTLLSAVLNLKNCLAFIHKLPAEILCSVFHEVVKNFESEDNVGPLLAISQTCQQWRGVACSDASLWSHLFVQAGRDPLLTNELLERSRNTSLSVDIVPVNPRFSAEGFSPVDENIFQSIHMLAPHGHRIVSMSVETHPLWPTSPPLSQRIDFDTPRLKELRISPTRGMCRRTGTQIPFLFKETFPQLQRLSITHFTAWPTQQFVNLIYINLTFVKGARDSMPFRVLFEVLERSPLLEELKLCHAGFTSAHNVGTSIVALHSLKTLWIEDFYSPILLSHLSLPPNVRVVSIVETESNNHNISGVAAVLPADLKTLPFVHNIVSIDMSSKSGDPGAIKLNIIDKYGGSLSATELIPRRLVRSPRSYYKLYLDSFPTLDLSQLMDLRLFWNSWDVGGIDHLSGKIALSMFQSMPALKNLVIADHTMVDFLTPLLPENQSLVCPLLETLEISIRPGAHPEIFALLFGIARSRYQGGCALRRLDPIFSEGPSAAALASKEGWKKWYRDYRLDEYLYKSDSLE